MKEKRKHCICSNVLEEVFKLITAPHVLVWQPLVPHSILKMFLYSVVGKMDTSAGEEKK